MVVLFFMHIAIIFNEQGKRDSNPRERFWRPSYCHCMIPLWQNTFVIIIHYDARVVHIREIGLERIKQDEEKIQSYEETAE